MTEKDSDQTSDAPESETDGAQERTDKSKSKLASVFAKLKTTASVAGATTMSGASAAAGAVTDSATTAGKAVTDSVAKAGGAVKDTASAAGKIVGDSVVGQTAARTSEEVGKQLDAISGAAILKLVEERLEIQSRYNDVLATKLNEALERIEQLERAGSSVNDERRET